MNNESEENGALVRISAVEIDLSDADDMTADEADELFERLQYYSSVGTIVLATAAIPSRLSKFLWLDRLEIIGEHCREVDCALLPRSLSHLQVGSDRIIILKNLRLLPNLVSLTTNSEQLKNIEALLSVEHPLLQCIVVRGATEQHSAMINCFVSDLQSRISTGQLFLGYSHSGHYA